ncbi:MULTISPECIES: porin family protein [Chryseobacterium]|uniref:PorT family protein n=1 Tax=Chryseobacterium bernardetii TaxID=1241978 RepID=A0A3G6TEK5_9FLAO|nr:MULTISPECIES: porin family protein [Chryseobacterium]AZB26323.1 PorT family protein [Chryseobacterium bernardetii]AZB32825.1 PorT family protein [Chryseobacterium bernardetii]UCA60587.1 PorT family protein [Chryseobacterium rhizoplanae]
MKKLFLGLALTAGTLAFAQESTTVNTSPLKKDVQPVRFGIKAGGNSAYFSEQKFGMNSQKLGFHAGAFVNIPISKQFSIQPEVLYNQMGARDVAYSTETTTGATTVKTKGENKVTMNYISVPLMVQMRPMDKFYIEAGPEFSYFINGKTKGEATISSTTGGITTTTTQSQSDDINKDNINRFNFGLGLGLGYDITNNIGISARYTNSLTKIEKSRPAAENNNRVFQLGLNYKF